MDTQHPGVVRLETGEFLTLLLMVASAALKALFRKSRGQHDRRGEEPRAPALEVLHEPLC